MVPLCGAGRWSLPASVMLSARPTSKPTPAQIGRDAHQVSGRERRRSACWDRAVRDYGAMSGGLHQAKQGGEPLGRGGQGEFHGDGGLLRVTPSLRSSGSWGEPVKTGAELILGLHQSGRVAVPRPAKQRQGHSSPAGKITLRVLKPTFGLAGRPERDMSTVLDSRRSGRRRAASKIERLVCSGAAVSGRPSAVLRRVNLWDSNAVLLPVAAGPRTHGFGRIAAGQARWRPRLQRPVASALLTWAVRPSNDT